MAQMTSRGQSSRAGSKSATLKPMINGGMFINFGKFEGSLF